MPAHKHPAAMESGMESGWDSSESIRSLNFLSQETHRSLIRLDPTEVILISACEHFLAWLFVIFISFVSASVDMIIRWAGGFVPDCVGGGGVDLRVLVVTLTLPANVFFFLFREFDPIFTYTRGKTVLLWSCMGHSSILTYSCLYYCNLCIN